ncbi:uncharacterized protein [Rutidosis leptorrhynchoides]|uniref:uncharacterized protein n=1 Tax=Rutidosis leptorrhynchoides TaxID=125765 RepID=UPI003A9A1251
MPTSFANLLMRPYPKSHLNIYILAAIDYVSKWAEAKSLLTNDARVVITFLKGIFARFGTLKALISDRGTHFCNAQMEKVLKRYGEWSTKLEDALWAFRTSYETPIGTTPYRLVYGKACYLPLEIEHKAHWALKVCNMDYHEAGCFRLDQLNELDELRLDAYENSVIYKEKTKRWHDNRIKNPKEFKEGDRVIFYNARYKFSPEKLKSRWNGPFVVKKVYPYGTIELVNSKGEEFKVNGHQVRPYIDGFLKTEIEDERSRVNVPSSSTAQSRRDAEERRTNPEIWL